MENKLITRQILPKIEEKLFKGKIVIIYGARQTGKTTLVKQIMSKYAGQASYFNCDEPDVRSALENKTSTELKNFLGDKRIIILDEAQRVRNIGLTLKLLVDNFPAMQIIATGSSSFELANEVVEPLTGRKYEFWLYPFSLVELKEIYSNLEIDRLLEQRIVFGMYPEIVLSPAQEAAEKIKSLVRSYLYKDILIFDKIRNSESLDKLLRALALQIGQEVSYNELADMVGVSKNTIQNYIQILEKAFIVFRVNPFSGNVRNELKKMRKIYFYDTGIRNALINNLNPLNLRQDTGALWENFIISERLKFNSNLGREVNMYFWRARGSGEIDYLEEVSGNLSAFEIKWRKSKFIWPKMFRENYPEASLKLVYRENYQEFVGL